MEMTDSIINSRRDSKKIRDKILACLYAGALGDALGYLVEFSSWRHIRKQYGETGIREMECTGRKAIISDDTQMTLFTAEGLGLGILRAAETGTMEPVEEYIYQAYLCWYGTQVAENVDSLWNPVSKLRKLPEMNVRRAPGITCLNALGSGEMGTIQKPINNSKGCGGVMRTAPLGFLRLKENSSFENGAKAAAITHGHPMGWIPGGMLSDIIERCIYGNYESLLDLIEASLNEAKAKYGNDKEFPDFEKMIRKAITLALQDRKNSSGTEVTDEPSIRSIGEGWVGDEALAVAIYSVLRWDDDIKNCLRSAVNHNGDSDSTGAVAGNIIGAYLGLEAVPQDWLEMLELTDAMRDIADLMIEAIEKVEQEGI